MQNRFVRNLAFLLFLNLLVKPFWILGVDRAVQNAVGDVMFGFYLSVYSYSFLFYILLDLGITNFNNRNIAQNNQLLNKHFAGIASLKLMLGLLYAVVAFGVGIAIGYNEGQLKLLAWIGLNQILLSFILYLRSNISGLLLFKADSLISVLDRLLMILICSVLLWSGWVRSPFQIEWFVYAQTLAYALTFLFALVFVLRFSGRIRLNFSWPFSLMIIRKSLPFALLVLLMSFYSRTEPVLLERLLPFEEGYRQAGIFGQAFRLLDAGNNISLLFAVLLLPLFSAQLKKGESVNKLAHLSFGLIISMSLLIAISTYFYSHNLMELLYGLREGETMTDFTYRLDHASMVFRVLMGSFVAVSSTYIFGTLLTAGGKLKLLNIVAASGVVINLVMNFILIPQFEAIGAAFSNLSAQMITAVLQFFVAKKVFKLEFKQYFWLRLMAYVVIAIVLGYLSQFLFVSWLWNLAALLVINGLLVFVFGILRFNEIKQLLFQAKASH
jgi:O-antigen/teichoic acid export membrane protein